jgi:hypothetical protein
MERPGGSSPADFNHRLRNIQIVTMAVAVMTKPEAEQNDLVSGAAPTLG